MSISSMAAFGQGRIRKNSYFYLIWKDKQQKYSLLSTIRNHGSELVLDKRLKEFSWSSSVFVLCSGDSCGSRYVSAAVDTVATISTDDNALAGFRWSLTLVAK